MQNGFTIHIMSHLSGRSMEALRKVSITDIVLFDYLYDGTWDRVSMLSGIRSNLSLEGIKPCPGRVVFFCGEVDRYTINQLEIRTKTQVYNLGEVYKNYKVGSLLREYKNRLCPQTRSWAITWEMILNHLQVFPFLKAALSRSCAIIDWNGTYERSVAIQDWKTSFSTHAVVPEHRNGSDTLDAKKTAIIELEDKANNKQRCSPKAAVPAAGSRKSVLFSLLNKVDKRNKRRIPRRISPSSDE